MGSSDFAVPALDALQREGHRISLVITQPDRVRARGGKVLPTPVGLFAAANGLPLMKPESLKSDEVFQRALAEAAPDLIVVASYGKLLPVPLLKSPTFGCVNIHASLLPEYRGAAPIQRAILDGKRETGVTLIFMSAALDAGDMIAAVRTDVLDMNAGELMETLARLGAKLLTDKLPAIADGTAPRVPQDEGLATYAEKIEKADGHIDLTGTAEEAVRRVRAMTPAPGAYMLKGGERIVVTAARAISPDEYLAREAVGEVPSGTYEAAAPGTAMVVSKKGIDIRTGGGVLIVEALKMPGKKAMPVCEYLKGNSFDASEPLE